VIVGPSGVGKTTLVARLREWQPDLLWSVSVTTRAARPGEVEGVAYHFVGNEEFDRLIENSALLEWAVLFGQHRSGTPRRPVEDALAEGRNVLIEVDVQGARAIAREMPDAVSIFVAPPSIEVLRQRLLSRRSEDPERATRRLARAEEELSAAGEFDHIVVNDDMERAWREIADIIRGSQTPPARTTRPS